MYRLGMMVGAEEEEEEAEACLPALTRESGNHFLCRVA